jgi:N-formylglutamate amidohydrolase
VVQLEMAWRAYIDEAEPGRYDPDRAAPLIGVLRQVVAAMAHA